MALNGSMTGMIMTAGASLLQNRGLAKSTGIDSAIDNISNSFPGFNTLLEAIEASDGALGGIGIDSYPGAGNAVPPGVSGNSMTGAIDARADEIMGSDLGVFCQHFATADGYVASTNTFITSLTDFASETFDSYSQSSLMTSAFADNNLALPEFGEDLVGLGNIIDLSNLNNLGNPLSLVKNLSEQAGGIAVLNTSLIEQGINPDSLNKLVTSTDVTALTNATVIDALGTGGLTKVDANGETLDVDKLVAPNAGLMATVYEAMGNVTGEDLDKVQRILGSKIVKLESMQDMLDPALIMPRSYPSLTSISVTGTLSEVYK